MKSRTSEEQRQVWEALKHLPSFHQKGSCPKPSRWNAWLETAQSGMSEWWGTRMILEYYLGDSHPDPDDAGSFKELRARNVKGLALAYLSLSQRNWEGCKLLQVFGRPCWSWHSKFHKTIKSPRAALGFCNSNVAELDEFAAST